jgi:hypothetical protein
MLQREMTRTMERIPEEMPETQPKRKPRHKKSRAPPVPTPEVSPTPRVARAKKPNTTTYWTPDCFVPTMESLADMKMPHPAILCDQVNKTIYTSSKLRREPYIPDPMTVVNDYFDILCVLGKCNRWNFTDWATNDTVQLQLRFRELADVDAGESGDVVTMETGEVIGGWWIEHGVGSFGIIQEPCDVTTLQKKKLENRIHIHYRNTRGVMCESFMYIVENGAGDSYYLQEEMSWFRIVCDEQGRHSVKMVDIIGRPVRSAVQCKKVVMMN